MFKNAENYNGSADYIALLVERIQAKHGMSIRQVAKEIGVGFATLRDLMRGRSTHNYPTQYILESLLNSDAQEPIMKYTIGKIDPTVIQGSKYERYIECETWADVRAAFERQGGLLRGKGSDVLDAEGNILFHSADYQAASVKFINGNERKAVPTLKACVAIHRGE